MKPSEESHYEGTEPVRGLPARLPAGEEILWQGEPAWRTLAVRMFHVRKLAIYFGLLLSYDAVSLALQGVPLAEAAVSIGQLLGLGVVAVGLLTLFCYAVSRTTVYTVTTKRVVIRAGIAVPKTVNLPYTRIESAGVKLHGARETGDIMLTPMPGDRIAYLVLWPHVQAWNLSHARPVLRAVPNAADVAAILGSALAADGQGSAVPAPAARRPIVASHRPAAA